MRYDDFRKQQVLTRMQLDPPVGFVQIPGSAHYYINNKGEVYNKRRDRYLNPSIGTGYAAVGVNINGKIKRAYVHRLVAEIFIGNIYNHPQVNHIDGNKLNNHVSNLEWCTAKENINHSYDKGLKIVKNRPKQSLQFMQVGEVQTFPLSQTNSMLSTIARLNKQGFKYKGSKSTKHETFTVERLS